MDPSQFDRIATRLAAHRANRRTTLGIAGAGIAAASLGVASARYATAQDATPVAEELLETVHPEAAADSSEYLFVQSFASGSIAPADAQDGRFTLTLDGANPQTVYFSDRPERVFGLATTTTFLEGLGFTPDDPPNAALVVTTESGDEDVLIIELFDPIWDEASGTLTYTVQVLSEYAEPGLAFAALRQSDFDLPESFGLGGIFIDGCSTGRIICYLYRADGSKGAVVGQSKVTPFCFENDAKKCVPCSSMPIICAESYPTQCRSGQRLLCGGAALP
jgi:hypothetical protein